MKTTEKFDRKTEPYTTEKNLRLAKKQHPPNIRYIYLMTKERKTTPEIPYAYATYGICVMEAKGKHRRIVKHVADVSTDKAAVIRLTALCNRYQLFPVHLKDVIEDMLTTPV